LTGVSRFPNLSRRPSRHCHPRDPPLLPTCITMHRRSPAKLPDSRDPRRWTTCVFPPPAVATLDTGAQSKIHRTHPSSLFVSRPGSNGSVQDELWRASICGRFGQRSQTGTRTSGASCASRSAHTWGRTCSGGTCLQTLEDRVVASNASGRPPTAHMSGEPGQAPNDAAARVRADLGLMSSNSQRARRTRHSRPTSAERRSQ
jgi:hypothetical protein